MDFSKYSLNGFLMISEQSICEYNLEWLDVLINVTLNPAKTDLSKISDDELNFWFLKIEEEKAKYPLFIIKEVFILLDENKISTLINQCHCNLIMLVNRAHENKEKISLRKQNLKDLYNLLIANLEELLRFLEFRFSTYLCLEKRVPATYLSVTKKELRPRMNRLKRRLFSEITDEKIKNIIFDTLNSFINPLNHDCSITFKEVHYIKELLKELEALKEPHRKTSVYSSLDKLLIYLNFNCKEYINYFTQNIVERINACESISDKMDCLLFYFKEFNQIHRKAGMALHAEQTDLKDELSNWFSQEIFYLEKKLHLSIVPLRAKTENLKEKTPVKNEKSKVLCILSTDQMALILRAADELKILMARSMNEVFKTIVPHLSTPYKENLSYDSMRSKSYTAEERDKEIAIQTLEKLIKKIKEY